VILHFGYPYKSGSTWGVLFNTSTFPFHSLTTLAALAENFAGGYWACSPVGTQLYLGLGENSAQTSSGNFFTASDGTAWANMVDSVNSWLVSNGFSGQVLARGAADMENASGWQSFTGDKGWVEAYGDASGTAMYNFGDAAGCPYTTYNNVGCNSGFNQGNFWFLSWGASAAWPAPEIYNETYVYNGSYRTDHNAQQWEMIKRYGIHFQNGSTMNFQASVTQRTACNEVDSCSNTNNSPSVGWTDLYDALNHDQAPSDTAQDLLYESDFEWGWGPCSTDPDNPGTAPC